MSDERESGDQPAIVGVILTIHSIAPHVGGPSRSVPALRRALEASGVPTELLTPNPGHSFRHELRVRLRDGRARIVHDNGVWLTNNHDAAAEARARGRPLVVSPRGMLEPWSMRHRAWKKQLAWWAYQRRDLQSAAVLHATSAMEAENLRALGCRAPIAIVPNGVDLPAAGLVARHGPGREEKRTALFLSRIHPKKGLLNLVAAWAAVRPRGWQVVVAGPDEGGHAAEVRGAIHEAGLAGTFELVAAVDGAAKAALFEQANLFVFPTYSENFGLVVAEALAYGVPVLTTKGAPWAVLEAERCGWWVDVGVQSLTAALARATALSDAERAAMGARGRDLVQQRFSWNGVGRDMRTVYSWVLGGGPTPACVQLF